LFLEAQERGRTADLVLTKDVLCQLSYLGIFFLLPALFSLVQSNNDDSVVEKKRAGNGIRTRDPKLGRLAL
jgi:hypothetical protein